MNQADRCSPPAAREGLAFATALTAVYAALAVAKVLQHVMWRDEWRAWMIARDSASVGELLFNLRYDGHPGLWYAILYAFSRLTRDPLAMKLAHVAIAAAAIWIVARYSPFTRLQRVLFAFGYFTFFEYSTISRAYGLGLLLAVAGCAVFVRCGARRAVTLAVLLALLANTSIYGLMLAITFALTYAVARWQRLAPAHERPRSPWRESLAAVIVWIGILASAALMFPGPDRQMIDGTWFGASSFDRIARTAATVWRGYVPLPMPQVGFWNTNVLDGFTWLQAGLSVAILGFVIASLYDRPIALTFILIGTTILLGATGLKFAGALRHHGHLFIVLLVAYWIARSVGGPKRRLDVLMTALLAAHAVAGLAASAIDAAVPFSASREVARYIRDEQLDDLPLIGHTDTAVSSVSGALDRPVYYLVERRFATFNSQDPRRRYPMFYGKMLQNIDQVVAAGGRGEALLIATEPLNLPPERTTLLATINESIVTDERYTLYRVKAGLRGGDAPLHE